MRGSLRRNGLPAELEAVAERYAIGLTPALAGLVRFDDPADPIGPVHPDRRELLRDPAETDDPIGDDAKSPVKGLVHRYPDRVLIKLVAVCAVDCRFASAASGIGSASVAQRQPIGSRARLCARKPGRLGGDHRR